MLQPIDIVKINTISQIKSTQNASAIEIKHNQIQQLSGIPRSYISFGQKNINDKERIAREDSRRRQKMANYLEVKYEE